MGLEQTAIFVNMVASRKTTVKPKLEEWISGWEEPTEWDRRLDQLNQYLNDIVGYRLPWICRSISAISQFSTVDWVKSESWGTVAEMLENGVDTQWALTALKHRGCPARSVIGPAGRADESQFLAVHQGQLIPVDVVVQDWISSLCDILRTDSYGAIDEGEISSLRDWLESDFA